jgi:hypothetical protein
MSPPNFHQLPVNATSGAFNPASIEENVSCIERVSTQSIRSLVEDAPKIDFGCVYGSAVSSSRTHSRADFPGSAP